MRSPELAQRQLKLEGAQLISRAALEKHCRAQRGSRETSSGRLVDVVPGPAVGVGLKVVCCVAAPEASRAAKRTERRIAAAPVRGWRDGMPVVRSRMLRNAAKKR